MNCFLALITNRKEAVYFYTETAITEPAHLKNLPRAVRPP